MNNLRMLTSKQVMEHFGPKPTVDSWYHYTSLDAIINGIIVRNPEPQKEICLWATHSQYMNDPLEFSMGVSLIDSMYKILEINNNTDLQQKWSSVKEFYKSCFLTCFSENADSLPMWIMYGNNGQGVALEFEKGIPEVDNEYILKCEYNSDNITPNIKDLLSKGNECVATYIALLPFILKHSAYNYENEIRYVSSFPNIPTYFRSKNGKVIPYKKVYLEKGLLKSVTIGPSANLEQVEQSLRLFLNERGFKNIPIKKSIIPYRCN